MKILNFSIIKILPTLLNKSKTQTIRPAWNKDIIQPNVVKNVYKPPRFKVGEKVQIVWKQRDHHRYFCSECGYGQDYPEERQFCIFCRGTPYTPFPKMLGTVEITEVFKIEMRMNERIRNVTFPDYINNTTRLSDLAEHDGFRSVEEMFQTLNKMYDLTESKEFHVYRWMWKLTIKKED